MRDRVRAVGWLAYLMFVALELWVMASGAWLCVLC